MRVPRVYGSASRVYTWQNNFLSNSSLQIGGGWEVRLYVGAGHAVIHGKIIILIILNPDYVGDARTREYGSASGVYT